MTTPIPNAGALDLLSAPFGGGMPSISGGDAGPSSAAAVSGHNDIAFSNSFSVAGAGGSSSATSRPTNQASQKMNYLLLAGAALVAIAALRKGK